MVRVPCPGQEIPNGNKNIYYLISVVDTYLTILEYHVVNLIQCYVNSVIIYVENEVVSR